MASSGHFKLLKRKLDGTVDQIGDDFSDFSLSSPATKIRRLDPELPPIVEEEGESIPVPNDERALVLFKPMNLHSPSDFSLTLSSDLISHIKNNQLSWSKQCDSSDIQDQNEENNRRLAIVPWVPQPSTSSSSKSYDDSEDNNNSNAIEMMEADEMGEEQEDGGAMMDVEQEENNSSNYNNYPTMLNLHHQAEGFQQHCFLPQIPQNTSTPITWTR